MNVRFGRRPQTDRGAYPCGVPIVREPSERNVKGALLAFLLLAGTSALMFLWVKSAAEVTYSTDKTAAVGPAIVLFWPLWGFTHGFLTKSGVVSGYRGVGKARLGGLRQKRTSVQTPIRPGFLTAIAISCVVSAIAIAAAGG